SDGLRIRARRFDSSRGHLGKPPLTAAFPIRGARPFPGGGNKSANKPPGAPPPSSSFPGAATRPAPSGAGGRVASRPCRRRRRRGGSVSASEFTPRFRWQLGLRDARNLSKAAKLVGHTLALHMDANGESCYPGVRLVAEETAQTTDTVCGAIDELLQARFLRVAVAASGRRPCKYAARLDCVPPIRTQGGFSVPSSRTQTGDVASDSDDVASESAERASEKTAQRVLEGIQEGVPAPTSARADDAAVEKR